MVGNEFSELQRLSIETDALKERLKRYYLQTFPKICSHCNTVYRNINEYYYMTTKGSKRPNPDSPGAEFNSGRLIEARYCTCGQRLVITTLGDRRDMSEAGKRRRMLFDEWLIKLKKSSTKSEEEIRDELRKIFNSIDSLFTKR